MRNRAAKGISAALVSLTVVAASFWATSAAADPIADPPPAASASPSASPGSSAPSLASTDPSAAPSSSLPNGLGRYIVTVDPGQQSAVANIVTDAGGIVTASYDKAIEGLAVQMSAEDASALASTRGVVSVEVDKPVSINEPSANVGGAVVTDPGCTTNSLPRGDDVGTSAVNLGFSVNWFGSSYSQILINNNGGLSFNDGRGSFTDYTNVDLRTTNRPLVLPLFTDIDTRNNATTVVKYGPLQNSFDGVTGGYCINWVNVGHYDQSAPYYSAQLIILPRTSADSGRATGDVDLIFNYDGINAATTNVPLEIGYADPANRANSYRFSSSGVTPNPYVDGVGTALKTNKNVPLGKGALDVNGRYWFQITPGSAPTATPTPTGSASPTATATPEPCSSSTPTGTQGCAPWGLDRIDQRSLPLNTTFTPAGTGAGVRAYVIDTGIYASNDFSTRLTTGYDFVDNDTDATDCHGHGTHVAGTVAGTAYGVAKQATLVPVRVLSCTGSGYTSDVIAGINWAISDHQAHPGPAVANMSLGGSADKSTDDAVAAAVAAGITMVVAAGNSNADACTASPARETTAITVGAIDSSDARASFSNYGTCVDIFAPGVSITSDGISSPTSTATMSGTSMASPHTAGTVAVYLGLHPTDTPAQVVTSLKASASTGVTNAGAGSPDHLLYARSFVANSASPSAPASASASSSTGGGSSSGGGSGSGGGGSSGGGGGGGGGTTADILEVRPAFGPTTGGNTINILGYGFWGTSGVTVGGKSATYKVIDASNIQVVAPPGVAGWQDVIVTLAVGRAVALGGYRYEAPVTPPPGQVVIQSTTSSSTAPAAVNSTVPVTRATVSSVRLAANGTMSISMRVAGAAKGQTVSLYKSGTKVRSGKVTKNGTVAFTGVAPTTGTYTVVLSKAGKTMSRSQPMLITAPRR